MYSFFVLMYFYFIFYVFYLYFISFFPFIYLFVLFCSVQARHLAVLSQRRASRTMWSSSHATTLWCTTRSTRWAGGPSSSGATWTTASRRSLWTESTRPTASTTSCSSAQVTLPSTTHMAGCQCRGRSLTTPPPSQIRGRCWRWSMCPRRVGTTWRSFCWKSWRSSGWGNSDDRMKMMVRAYSVFVLTVKV